MFCNRWNFVFLLTCFFPFPLTAKESAPAAPSLPKELILTEEAIEKKSKAIIEEYLHINDLKVDTTAGPFWQVVVLSVQKAVLWKIWERPNRPKSFSALVGGVTMCNRTQQCLITVRVCATWRWVDAGTQHQGQRKHGPAAALACEGRAAAAAAVFQRVSVSKEKCKATLKNGEQQNNLMIRRVSAGWKRSWRLRRTWPLIYLVFGSTSQNLLPQCSTRVASLWDSCSGQPPAWTVDSLAALLSIYIECFKKTVPLQWCSSSLLTLGNVGVLGNKWIPSHCAFREISKPLLPVGQAGVLLVEILQLLCKEMVRQRNTSLQLQGHQMAGPPHCRCALYSCRLLLKWGPCGPKQAWTGAIFYRRIKMSTSLSLIRFVYCKT